MLAEHAGLAPPLRPPGPGLPAAGGGRPGRGWRTWPGWPATGRPRSAPGAADRARLWAYRERHPEAAGFLGVPLKLDVSVPAARWVRLASEVAGVVAEADPGATGDHLRPRRGRQPACQRGARRARPAADGRHEDAVFSFVASLGGSISAEHGIGALKARWLPLVRSDAERALFARLRAALRPGRDTQPPRPAPPARLTGAGSGRPTPTAGTSTPLRATPQRRVAGFSWAFGARTGSRLPCGRRQNFRSVVSGGSAARGAGGSAAAPPP